MKPKLWQTACSQKPLRLKGATKSIGELTQDEFLRILGPDQGSSRDGSRVAVGRSTRDSCVNVVDGKLQVNGSDEFRRTVEVAYEAKKTPSSGFGSAPYRPEPKPEPEPTLSKLMPKTQEPVIEEFDVGYYWNEHHQSKDAIYKKLYGPEANFQQQSMFERNNEHLQDMVLPGELVILANEPKTLAEKDRLILLKTQAKEASEGIQKLTPAEATTLYRNFEIFDFISTQDLAMPSAAFGGVSSAVSQRFKDLHDTIKQIDTLYVQHIQDAKGGRLSPAFYEQRKILFSKLDNSLEKLTLKSLRIPEYNQLKHRLGLSTKSLTHNWRTVSRHGEVSALGQRLNSMSKYVKGAEKIGYIGVGLDAVTGLKSIVPACSEGISEECTVISLRETAKVYGSYVGGSWGATAGSTILVSGVSAVALVLGVTVSAPVIAVASVSGAVVGGFYGGSVAGDFAGDIFETSTKEIIRIVGELK